MATKAKLIDTSYLLHRDHDEDQPPYGPGGTKAQVQMSLGDKTYAN
jgi:hypothetical protein